MVKAITPMLKAKATKPWTSTSRRTSGAAITAAKGGAPLELLIQRGSRFQTVSIDYKGGLRWPWLERAAPGKAPTGLDLLLSPKRPMAKPKGK